MSLTPVISLRFGEERYEKRDLQVRVRQRFEELREADEGRIPWHMIDASQSMEAVTENIADVVQLVLEEVARGKQLQKLWTKGVYELTIAADDVTDSST
jgi:dTMP kinase